MKLGRKKAAERRQPGRQRRQSDWSKPAAFSYHAKRSERPEAPGRQQPSLAQKRHRMLSLQFWLRRSGLLIAIIAGIVCLVSLVSLSNKPRIIFLDQNGSDYAFRSEQQYQDAASSILSSSVWNRNKITVNTGAAQSQLKKQFPELAGVSVSLPLVGQRPIFYLKANPPSFVFQTVNGNFVLDSGGTALITKEAADPATVSQLPVITDQTGIQASLGKQVISSSEARFIQTIVDSLAAKQVTVNSLILPAAAVQELHLTVVGQGYTVKFNMHDVTTARQQAGTYLATVANLANQKIVPAQYIDVRVLGRAYYQ